MQPLSSLSGHQQQQAFQYDFYTEQMRQMQAQQAQSFQNQIAWQQQAQKLPESYKPVPYLNGKSSFEKVGGAIIDEGIEKTKKELEKELRKGKKVNMVREYLNKHRDIVFTLVIALLVDHFVLNGALRQRIQKVIEAALNRVEKALGIAEEKVVGQ